MAAYASLKNKSLEDERYHNHELPLFWFPSQNFMLSSFGLLDKHRWIYVLISILTVILRPFNNI